MQVILISPFHDYGYAQRGPGWDFYNLESGFIEFALNNNIEFRIINPDRHKKEEIFDIFDKFDADIIIENYFTESLEIPIELFRKARLKGARIFRYDCDSAKRYPEIFKYRERYDGFITADPRMIAWYQENDLAVYPLMFAAGPIYKNLGLERDIDVSFIGQSYGIRAPFIEFLIDNGINVKVFGRGWYGNWGHEEYKSSDDIYRYLSTESMIEILNRSKISLNFSNTHDGGIRPIFPTNVKGRHFEIPACGACQISTPCPELLEQYFKPGEEIFIVNDARTMLNLIEWLLQHNQERERVAKMAQDRVDLEHRWHHRFGELFSCLGL